MLKIATFSLPILFCALLFRGHADSQLYDEEHEVLMKLKQHWRNPPSIAHWTPSNSSHCNWLEITCTSNSITGLSLINMSISETIPSFICELKNLTDLDLQYNNIPGNFPIILYDCSKLEYLDLSQNHFVGPIPQDIDSLSQLRFLNIGANNFTGGIPASVGNLTELKVLQLYQNPVQWFFPTRNWQSAQS
ncbi:hypothetical protein Patl1_13344 [Pistacia atlantica]|uniref:Uncharacterized protein n=1 Tax=Pistacia atlantica TaxID=434234 RepID=A0ACC1AYA8_9ROSI|nr:hypothetical protein Patl1_13344 [Pistacia atlantica]